MFGYHFGYQAAYFSRHFQNEKNWSDRIYGSEELHLQAEVLEIPLTMPYMPDQDGFSETNSTFERDGKLFRIIKQRYHQDTLQIVFVPDFEKQDIRRLLSSWMESSDQPSIPTQGFTAPHPEFKPYVPHDFDLVLPIAGACSTATLSFFVLPTYL